jgi:hypothetical protein
MLLQYLQSWKIADDLHYLVLRQAFGDSPPVVFAKLQMMSE